MDDGWDAGDVEDIGSDWDPWQGALDQDLPEGIEIIRDDDRDWHDEEYAEENESSDDEDSADEDLPPEDGPTFDPRPSGGGTRNPLLDYDAVGQGHSDGGWGGFFGGADHSSSDRENQADEDDNPEEDSSILERLRRWWNSLLGRSEQEQPDPMDVIIDAAETCVADFDANGAEEHEELCRNDTRYRGSMEHTIACQKETLAIYLRRYEADANSRGSDALVADAFWGPKIAVVLDSIHYAEKAMKEFAAEADEIEAKWRAGRLSRSAYDDAMHNVEWRRRRAVTRLEMGGLGMTYDDLGDLSDQASHVVQDALLEDGGELRQEIARRIRRLPRQVALDMLDRAVADGAIPQEVADYLRREYVRSR